MSSASFYDWEKSLQSNSPSQFTFSPSSIPKKEKSKGTIDYFMDKNEEKRISKPNNNPVEDLSDIGEIIFKKIVRLWKMKNLE